MKVINWLIIITLFLFSSCKSIFTTTHPTTKESLKKEGLEFSLKFVEALFNEDCDKVYAQFAEEVYSMDGDEIYILSEYREDICESIDEAIYGDEKTYNDYLKDYRKEILTPEQVVFRFKFKFPEFYQPHESDLFFIGAELKNEESEDYISEDYFVFLIRKIEGRWQIKGVE